MFDGTYTLNDLLDYHEMMTVAAENQRRIQEAIRRQQEAGM